jgi:hypothetical protein
VHWPSKIPFCKRANSFEIQPAFLKQTFFTATFLFQFVVGLLQQQQQHQPVAVVGRLGGMNIFSPRSFSLYSPAAAAAVVAAL